MLSESGAASSGASESPDMSLQQLQWQMCIRCNLTPIPRANQCPAELRKSLRNPTRMSASTICTSIIHRTLIASLVTGAMLRSWQLPQCKSWPSQKAASAAGRHRLHTPQLATRQPRGRRTAANDRLVTCMGIKAVEAFDGSFTLSAEAEATLKQHLSGETFCKQACPRAPGTQSKSCTATMWPTIVLTFHSGTSGGS